MRRRKGAASGASRAHGRRDTNTYPPKPRTTGTINNIPNTVLTIVFSIPLCIPPTRVPHCGTAVATIRSYDYVDSAGSPSPSPKG